ncbi:hypothetical protein [Pseudomonas xionganensis]|uniref:Uncharacterized protein n=1 Tax=Pseudomonas xionganensis TaxID=2654845 RepID=A0A6I4KY12_9PSED|nr:hypothetical protein [Pseudomonas xionganensis]MVW75396.1 hypothetical protein [Pseudomonas xionganensis]
MQRPPLVLGGIEIPLHAGALELGDEEIGGEASMRLSNGDLVTMSRWKKAAGTVSARGFMPPGLDGLDFSAHHEFHSTQVSSAQSTGLVFNLTSTPRPDKAPWAFALVNGQWHATPCSTLERVATVTPVPGATLYQVWWMPVYQVKATRPRKSQSGLHGWEFSWVET